MEEVSLHSCSSFLLEQMCSQTEKSVVPCTLCWALRKLPFWFSFSLVIWDYRILALIVLKLKDSSVKGNPNPLNYCHCSGFLSPLLLQECGHPAPAPAPILPSWADIEERDRIDHSRIDGRLNSSSERQGFCHLSGWLFVCLGFLFCFCMCGLYVAGCCFPPPQRVLALPLLAISHL